MKNYGVILASGKGERTGLDIPKQFFSINGRTILEHTLDIFDSHNHIDTIIIVVNEIYLEQVNFILEKNNYQKIEKVVLGGATRQISSYNGVNSIDEVEAKILIHDAVRPFVTEKTISDCIIALDKYKAVNVAIESSDTIIEVDSHNILKSIPERKHLRRCQTPQGFLLSTIKKAHVLAKNEGIDNITDDCGLILKYNLADIYVVQGSVDNIKITYPLDIEIAKLILKKESI